MKKMIKFPSIEQFRSTVSNIKRRYNFVGLDDNGEAVYDHTLPKPKLVFKGTVKLHGTNAAICYNGVSGFWAQSRENIITPEKDNAGFAFFAESKKDVLINLVNMVAKRESVDLLNNTITIYGEWCGGNIQKGVGVCNLPKSLFIFGVKISPFEVEGLDKQAPAYWVDCTDLGNSEDRIYNINDFQTYEMEVDFNSPELVQNKFSELTIAVEEECPVAKAFGFSGIGEGIVWTTEVNGERYLFKVKGEKHSASKVKVLAAVDVEKVESIQKFVDYAVTESRLDQAIENVFPNNEPLSMHKFGDVVRWMVNDIIKEEMDVLVENNLEPKSVNSKIASQTKEMFLNKL
jgi:hypothetical protein